MISEKMSKLLERSAAMSSMYTESARLKEKYGAENVYDFGMGNPNLPAPDSIRETSIRILRETDPWYLHHYMPNNGFPEARKKIAESLNRRFGEHFEAQNIMMCTGAAGGINCLLKVLMDPGQEILTFAPYFGEYDRYADNVNCTLTAVPPNPPDFQPNPAALERCVTEKTRAVLIDNPNNPTGVVYDEATIKAMAAILEKKEKEFGTSIVLISDEPYRELAYGGVEVPFVTKYYHNAVVGYSYSKSLSVPGERIGYVVIPDEVDDSAALIGAATIANRVIGCVNAPSLVQKVIKYCIEHEVTVDLETYEKNRNLIYGALTEYGFTCAKPDGAFYLFVKSPVENEKEFCEVAKKHHVLMVPGSSFACPGYVRLAYCVSYEQIERSLPAFKKIAEEYGLCK